MKNSRFLMPVMAILTVFAMLGCPVVDDPGQKPSTITVTFIPYAGVKQLKLTIPKDESLGASRYSQVQALQARDGYEFKGWSLTANGEPATVSASSKWTADTTYHGLWKQETEEGQSITITYDLNGFPGEKPANAEATSGEAIGEAALPELTATAEGNYAWLGWSETKGGDVIGADAVFRSDTTLYARWMRYITITYNMNGFPGAEFEAKRVSYGEAIGEEALPALNAPDYRGLGWSLTATGAVITASASFTEDVTLYARHQPAVTVTVTYNLNGFPIRPTAGKGYSAPNGTSNGSNETIVANQDVLIPQAPADKYVVSGEAIGTAAITPLTTGVPGYTWQGWATTAAGTPVTATTVFSSATTLYARYTFSAPAYTPPATLNFDIPYDLHPLRTNISDDWIRGADISNCFEIEQYGGQYRNFNGQVEDIMKILVDNGVNYVRLRLWVDPDAVTNHYSGDGKTNMAVIKVIAARAKAAGMKILLDYHYSDYWADPGQQYVPVSWNVTSAQEMYDKVEEYTRETIQELIDFGARPDMVQLGNEVRSGLLRQKRSGAPSDQFVFSNNNWTQYANAFAAGSRAARSFGNDIKIMIQFDNGGGDNISGFRQFTQTASGGAATTGVNVDYDIIGLSWYTYWSSHGSLSNLYTQIGNLKSTFGKEVVVCESGFGFDFGDDRDYPPGAWKVNFKQGFTDNLSNVYGKKNSGMESQGATRLSGNTQRHVADSGIPYTISSFAGNAENQARGYRAFMDAVAAAGGAGVMWWGADWFAPVMGLNSNVENSALFDFTGRALPALRVLGGIKGPDKAKPGKVTGLAVTITGTTANLTWDTVNTAITNKYRIERATSASGPWTTVDDNITGNNTGNGTYSDAGLAGETTYYYRVSANNANGWGVASDTKNIATGGFVPAGLSITPTVDTAVLTWTALSGATKYEVQRATASTGPWTMVKDDITGTTYTDTGLTPATAYYYRVRGYNTAWGNPCEPVGTTTAALATPTGLRVTGTTTTSLSLAWNAVSGAASYKLYGAQAASAPADSAYTELYSGAVATYTHSGLTEGAVWWYKVSAVYTTHGEGARSAAASGKVGALDLKATISMTSGTLDADFLDSQKAASSTDAKPYTGSDTVINYTIVGMYVANDADNLYVALDFGDKVPIGYNYDRFVVWVSNTSSSAAGVTVGTSTGEGSNLGINNGRITNGQTITGTIHGWAYRMFRNSTVGGSTGRAFNIGTWSNPGSDNWVWQPGGSLAGSKVFKVSIPLAQIGGAVAGNELRVFGAFSQGHGSNANNVGVGSLIPSAAAPGATCSSGTGDIVSVTVNMNNALAYTVK